MDYLDTNVIIYAIENHQKYGKACKKILEHIVSQKIKVCSSMLVLIEIINVLKKINKILNKDGQKELDLEKNIESILSLPIIWLDINFLIIKKASEYSYDISGVDYIHLASMELHSSKKIISADKELDKIEFIKRIDPLEC